MTVLFTTSATANGGRSGKVVSPDNVIDIPLVTPKEIGGSGEEVGTNPEQLLAAGYAACFDGYLNLIVKREKIEEVTETVTKADVHFIQDKSDGGFKVGVDLHVKVEGVDKEKAQELVEKAHEGCPYSKATRGNVEVNLHVL